MKLIHLLAFSLALLLAACAAPAPTQTSEVSPFVGASEVCVGAGAQAARSSMSQTAANKRRRVKLDMEQLPLGTLQDIAW